MTCDEVEQDLREIAGVTALIYDQTCAAEKRRRRKTRRLSRSRRCAPSSTQRVCENCGDCSRAIQLHVGGPGRDRIRPQAPDRPVLLQQGFFLRRRLLSELRHRARRRDCARPRRRRSGLDRQPARPAPAALAEPLQHPHRRRRRHRRGDARRGDRRRRRAAKARTSPRSTWPAWRRRAARSPPISASRRRTTNCTPPASRRAKPRC